MKTGDLKDILVTNHLKVTPQRMAVLKAIYQIQGHPTPEEVHHCIHRSNPNIAIGTVYKTLETFVEKGILRRVKTDKGLMKYDSVNVKHHHLYCAESEKIEDYFDEELDRMLKEYFDRKQLPHFEVMDIKLQISGKFNDQST